ncbi:MAG: ATP-grasp domain-containing protein [Waddliaceae bacterium]
MKPKKILLTGTRLPCALDLARQLHRTGHDVYAADTSSWHVTRFSNAITKFFLIPSPRHFTDDFIDSIVNIVEKEKIDLLIPIWEEVFFLSGVLERFPKSCEVFCSPFELIHELHNKWLFNNKLGSLGFKTPHSILLRSNDDPQLETFKKPYVLKACYSRGSHRLINSDSQQIRSMEIAPDNLWIAQEFIQGEHYSSYSVCFRGKVLAHSLYPVRYTLDGNTCLVFESVSHQAIFKWVEQFIEKIHYTGQIAFDFIETPAGDLYAIECNPRATSGLHLFAKEDRLDQAFLHTASSTIFPRVGNSKQITMGMLLYGWRMAISENKKLQYFKKFISTQDVIFDLKDIKPFLFQPCILVSYLFKSKKKGKPIPVWITYDLEWDKEQ